MVRGNEIRANRFDGIAIEHGQNNAIEDNRIEENRNGIRLWSDPVRQTPGSAGNLRRRYTVSGNRITDSRECGILVTDDQDLNLEGNSYERNARDCRF